ncbi:MAG TPA: UDP-glucose/GDP-mannose dehydrogenase family protein [Candidatus Humimicrobiaceae bacterium]|nr:UDP-glucose/GDP-mannose dehydrogenase family protein [Candidatus Humimicrobiaceae bacterium]
MKVCVIGTGYVGLVTGVCLAEIGNKVLCVDKDKEKINLIEKGNIPIYEEGLAELIKKNKESGNLVFHADTGYGIKESDIIFICVGTPPTSSGNPDLSAIDEVAKLIGQSINGYKIISNKSTVPIGTAKRIKKIIKENQNGNNSSYEFDIVSNPEFLKEGEAVRDAFFPERIVIGSKSKKAVEIMKELYGPIINQDFDYARNNTHRREKIPVLITDSTSSELIKYASNAFLATKISFINEIANICERVGANILDVTYGMGLDSRIGSRFMKSGIGWGGSCFPKDVRALSYTAEEYGSPANILNAVIQVNNHQRFKVVQKAVSMLGIIDDKVIGILGLAFKPNTNDTRDAPSVTIINKFLELGAEVRVYDPVIKDYPENLDKGAIMAASPYEAVEGTNLMVLVTEWDEFYNLDFSKIKNLMASPNIIDGRNIFDKKKLQELGFNYTGIGN